MSAGFTKPLRIQTRNCCRLGRVTEETLEHGVDPAGRQGIDPAFSVREAVTQDSDFAPYGGARQ